MYLALGTTHQAQDTASLAVILPIIPPSSKSPLIQTKSGSHAKSKIFKNKKTKKHHL